MLFIVTALALVVVDMLGASPGSLAPYKGVGQGCGRPCSANRLGYP